MHHEMRGDVETWTDKYLDLGSDGQKFSPMFYRKSSPKGLLPKKPKKKPKKGPQKEKKLYQFEDNNCILVGWRGKTLD